MGWFPKLRRWCCEGDREREIGGKMKRNGNCYCFVFALMSSSSIAESFFITQSFNHNNTHTQEMERER